MSKFREAGYRVLGDLLPESRRQELYLRARELAGLPTARRNDPMVPDTPCVYGDPAMDGLMSELCPRIERETEVSLYPTYSYFRVYKHGDVLHRHTDRDACEFGISLNLGHDAETSWPLWLEKDGEPRAVTLAPGEGLLYRGTELPHWREPFEGRHSVQLFMHYVDQNGPWAMWRFDRRRELGTSGKTRDLSFLQTGGQPI